jgi:hypothetical protein
MLVGFLSDIFSNTLNVLHSVKAKNMLKLKYLISQVNKTIKTLLFYFTKDFLWKRQRKNVMNLK